MSGIVQVPFLVYLDKARIIDIYAAYNDGAVVSVEETLDQNNSSSQAISARGTGGMRLPFFKVVSAEAAGQFDRTKQDNESIISAQTRVFTEGSFFSNIKKDSYADVKRVISDFEEGALVEIRGTLHENSVRDTLRKAKSLLPYLDPIIRVIGSSNLNESLKLIDRTFEEKGFNREERRRLARELKTQKEEAQEAIETATKQQLGNLEIASSIIDLLISELTENNRVMMTCELNQETAKAMFLLDRDSFVGREAHELSGGNYFVWGKIIRKHASYNTVRSTSLSFISDDFLESQLKAALDSLDKNTEFSSVFNVGKIEPIIEGPVYEILPIAVYV